MMLVKNFQFCLRRTGRLVVVSILVFAAVVAYLVLAIIHGTRSSAPISEWVRKLLPAGNCLCESSTVFNCGSSIYDAYRNKNGPGAGSGSGNSVGEEWQFDHERDGFDFGLSDAQCDAAFPGLFEEVHRAIGVRFKQQSNITLAELDAIKIEQGHVRAMIVDGKIRVLESRHTNPDHRKKGLAILYSIYRAISAHRRATPNIEFVFSIDDMVSNTNQPIWTLARRPQDHDLWIMPDFGFWSWDLQDLAAIDDVIEQVIRDESLTGWDEKTQKLVWRGKPQMLPTLRRALLDVSMGKPWSDVEGLTPEHAPKNYISAADQCKYMFIAHAEGRSYSGSLKYRQLCHSVIIIHKMQWIQHHHYLLVANGTQQNFVEVERDFSDLETKIEYLIAHPEEAKRIADNNVKTFRERYFAPAAEACYWRALIQGWAASSFEPEPFVSTPGGGLGQLRGMRFENYALLETPKMMDFTWKKTS